jgi:Ceramidase
MNWDTKIFAYCERGSNPSFWAEPLNAISNIAFLIAALLALSLWISQRRELKGAAELALIGVTFLIAIGSFLMHTFATRWAMLADTVPIFLFMLGYLVFATRRFAGSNWFVALASVAAFIGAGFISEIDFCDGGRCLNGSLGYVPALAAMMIMGGALQIAEHPASRALLTAAVIFAVSLTFRSVDMLVCPATLIQPGWRAGTHATWHVLNATVIYLLLRAAVMHG